MVRKAKEEPLDEPFGLNGSLWEGGHFERNRDTLREVVFALREGMGTLREWAPWEGTMGWKGTLRERVGTLREWVNL